MHTNPEDLKPASEESKKLGFETSDVNVGSILVFLGGLFGFVVIFFFFCFFMGRVINDVNAKHDGPTGKWNTQIKVNAGGGPTVNGRAQREDLKSNAALDKQELDEVGNVFPQPRLETDDGNLDISELHSREDLLLDHYSKVPGETGIRIPVSEAMKLIAERGLPVAPASPAGQKLAYDTTPSTTVPLTNGFARTGYEQQAAKERAQRLDYGRATSEGEHAELHPVK
jgi:hypothetical protein